MKYFILLFICSLLLIGNENYISTQYTSLQHEDTPINTFLSVYTSIEKKFSFHNGDLEINMGAKGLSIIKKSGDFELFNTINKKKDMAIVDNLSIDYYPTSNILMSIGIEKLDINLLRGSFDGILLSGVFNDFLIKTFYFNRYSVLYPTYYKNEKINLLGTNLSLKKENFESEILWFNYDDQNVQGFFIAFHLNDFTLATEHIAFSSIPKEDEKAYKAYLSYDLHNFHMEAGYYNVYEGSLENIYTLGGTEFKTFELNSFLNQNNSKNIYLDLNYDNSNFYSKVHFARTTFLGDDNLQYTGDELGITLRTYYKKIELSTTYFLEKSNDEYNSKLKRAEWLQINMGYKF